MSTKGVAPSSKTSSISAWTDAEENPTWLSLERSVRRLPAPTSSQPSCPRSTARESTSAVSSPFDTDSNRAASFAWYTPWSSANGWHASAVVSAILTRIRPTLSASAASASDTVASALASNCTVAPRTWLPTPSMVANSARLPPCVGASSMAKSATRRSLCERKKAVLPLAAAHWYPGLIHHACLTLLSPSPRSSHMAFPKLSPIPELSPSIAVMKADASDQEPSASDASMRTAVETPGHGRETGRP
mmetsp:Transcript_88800/g.133078  ORF Transcript_88800/g.133078 Transcript_88800/m.133078 type:complete len:247 (-) Transcript_88800:1688-2428(-)